MKLRKIQKKKFRKKAVDQVEITTEKRKQIEIKGVIYLAVGILLFFSFHFKNSVGVFGVFINSLLFGMFGFTAFVLPYIITLFGFMMLFKKGLDKLSKRIIHSLILIALASALFHTANYDKSIYENLSFGDNVVRCFKDGILWQSGGVIGGLLSMPFLRVFQVVGTIIIIAATSLVEIVILTEISLEESILKIVKMITKMANYCLYLVHNYKTRRRAKQVIMFDAAEEELIKKQKMEKQTAENVKEQEPGFISSVIGKARILKKSKLDGLEKVNIAESLKNKAKVSLIKARGEELNNQIESDKKSSKERSGLVQDNSLEKTNQCDTISESNNDILEDTNIVNYKYPAVSLLSQVSQKGTSKDVGRRLIQENAKKLEETLLSFGVEAKVVNYSSGPAVTRYELTPSPGVKVSRIVALSDDISLSLAAAGIRIEAPIPGKSAIGIEVPNKEMGAVCLREVVESEEFKENNSKLAVAIGKDITGRCIVADMSKMPHVLIAGATGSGKSVCINTIIMSVLYKASPSDVKMVMIDPKAVELTCYNGIPHLLIPVVTDPKKAAGALNWAVVEMVNRYKAFSEKGVRDIMGYNAAIVKENPEGRLPQILIIIDELADLMMVAKNDVEDAICRLSQMARAAGMHLVVATQRPSVDVITGVIKANIPSRIAFAVSSQVDSRTILDMAGAEKLLGQGDMLYSPIGASKPIRVKGTFVSVNEVETVVDFVKKQEESKYDETVIKEINQVTAKDETIDADNDELLPQAADLVVDAGHASVSLIQRRFKVGYARAARIIDQMELKGIVGPFEGSKPRQVLIGRQQLLAQRVQKDVSDSI